MEGESDIEEMEISSNVETHLPGVQATLPHVQHTPGRTQGTGNMIQPAQREHINPAVIFSPSNHNHPRRNDPPQLCDGGIWTSRGNLNRLDNQRPAEGTLNTWHSASTQVPTHNHHAIVAQQYGSVLHPTAQNRVSYPRTPRERDMYGAMGESRVDFNAEIRLDRLRIELEMFEEQMGALARDILRFLLAGLGS